MKLYLRNVIYPYIVHRQQEAQNNNLHFILICDNAPCHNIETYLQENHHNDIEIETIKKFLHIIKLPPNTSSLLSPLDLTVNGPLKAYLRKIHHQYVQDQQVLLANGQIVESGVPSRQQCQKHVAQALKNISSETIIHGFEKAEIISPIEVRQIPEPIIVIPEDRFFMAFAEDETEELRWTKLSGTHIFNQDRPCSIPNHLIGVVNYKINMATYFCIFQLHFMATFVKYTARLQGG
ncbi:Conserved_hypothetical protein [Hexamita inflata]|uniref:DDE-1 domain-containing protein n=1 Tax=Hexamita inflata TaxID=28002 RepID=A0AA86N5T7_9EUKA|nr:Conserved hypothetical protein [Hexamita inflata]